MSVIPPVRQRRTRAQKKRAAAYVYTKTKMSTVSNAYGIPSVMRARAEEHLDHNLTAGTFHSADQFVLGHQVVAFVGFGGDGHQVGESCRSARSREGGGEYIRRPDVFTLSLSSFGGSDRPEAASITIKDGGKNSWAVKAWPTEPVH